MNIKSIFRCQEHQHEACYRCTEELDRLKRENEELKKGMDEVLSYIEVWANFSNGEPEAKRLLSKFKQEDIG